MGHAGVLCSVLGKLCDAHFLAAPDGESSFHPTQLVAVLVETCRGSHAAINPKPVSPQNASRPFAQVSLSRASSRVSKVFALALAAFQSFISLQF